MRPSTVKIEKPEEINFILAQSHFIKTVEDIHDEEVYHVIAGVLPAACR